MLQTLKHTKIFTNLLLIYKWALCQVSFEHLTNIGFLKTLYAGTLSLIVGRPKFVLLADAIYSQAQRPISLHTHHRLFDSRLHT
jgi:hypothetical protein